MVYYSGYMLLKTNTRIHIFFIDFRSWNHKPQVQVEFTNFGFFSLFFWMEKLWIQCHQLWQPCKMDFDLSSVWQDHQSQWATAHPNLSSRLISSGFQWRTFHPLSLNKNTSKNYDIDWPRIIQLPSTPYTKTISLPTRRWWIPLVKKLRI